MDRRIKRECPNCQNGVKSVTDLLRCSKCYHVTCPACRTIGGLCIDCYTLERVDYEFNSYFGESMIQDAY